MAQKIFPRILKILGCLLLLTAILIVVFGIWYGVRETDAFYQRQDDYHALDDERQALKWELDSLRGICYMEETEDSFTACSVQAQIDSIESTARYAELLGTPEPPVGFSLAGLVSVFACLIALLPLILGIILIVVGCRKRKKHTM